MTWKKQFASHHKRPATSTPITQVAGILDIPPEATPEQRFRLVATITKIIKQCTKAGDDCYFLHCHDDDKTRFDLVLWRWQYEQLQGEVVEGVSLQVDVRVPKDGYSAFTLA
jgi:DNA polymerase III alpha subunit